MTKLGEISPYELLFKVTGGFCGRAEAQKSDDNLVYYSFQKHVFHIFIFINSFKALFVVGILRLKKWFAVDVLEHFSKSSDHPVYDQSYDGVQLEECLNFKKLCWKFMVTEVTRHHYPNNDV